ncbi:hypothetical protein [Staphylococcus hominis]|uniref:hypothetical protein n=1 Tax=Staphylococcus hominis TaxID=1290 RepID=UPI0034D4D178
MKIDWLQLIIALSGSTLFTSIIVALINHFLNKKFNEKKLNAEIISKSRIQWINEVRSISAKFIYKFNRCVMLKRKRFDVIKKKERLYKGIKNKKIPKTQENLEKLEEYKKKISKLVDKFNEEYAAVIENSTILKLYFTTEKNPDSNLITHQQILKDMKTLNNSLRKLKSTSDEKDMRELRNNYQGLIDLIGNYLKQEWEKSKELK